MKKFLISTSLGILLFSAAIPHGVVSASEGKEELSPPSSPTRSHIPIVAHEGKEKASPVSAFGSTFEFSYGPYKKPLNLTKSADLIGIKPHSSALDRDLEGLLGSETNKFKPIRMIGGFQILQFKEGKNVNYTLDSIRKLDTISLGTHIYKQGVKNSTPFVPTGELYITFAKDADPETCTELLDHHGLTITQVRGERELVVRVTNKSDNPIKVTTQLQKSPLLEVAEPDLATLVAIKGFTLPRDELLKDQWHLRNTGMHRGTKIGLKAGADARVVDAWEFAESYGSPTITVAVIDDGFDPRHPDISGLNKIVSPWDFTRNNNNPAPGREVYLDEFGNFMGDWHGTACAGVAVGNLEGGKIIGAAPLAKLMPVRWGSDLSDAQIEKWFGYVTKQGADVVSCSWGAAADYFPLSTRKFNAISSCADKGRGGKGCVIVFAAGNSNHDINDPLNGTLDGFAIHPKVIAVAASTSTDKRSSYSNFGKEIFISAPSSGAGGMGILTSDVTGSRFYQGSIYSAGYEAGDYTYTFGGTSSACPLVAGVSALVLSANSNLTRQGVMDILKKTARRTEEMKEEHSIYFGYGYVNAKAAVAEAIALKGGSSDSSSSISNSSSSSTSSLSLKKTKKEREKKKVKK